MEKTKNSVQLVFASIFFCLASTALADGLTLNQNGNVGIGTENPAAKLQIEFPDNGDIGYKTGIFVNYLNGYPNSHKAAIRVDVKAYDSAHRDLILLTSKDISRFVVQANGKVGIGIDAPSYKLDVAGNVRADNVSITSDKRLKKDIKKLDNALTKLSKIRGVSYKWNDLAHARKRKSGLAVSPDAGQKKNSISETFDVDDKTHVGLLAQEVERVFPEVVQTDRDGMKSIAYAQLIGPVIEALKELKQENEKLKNRISVLEQEISR